MLPFSDLKSKKPYLEALQDQAVDGKADKDNEENELTTGSRIVNSVIRLLSFRRQNSCF